MFAIVLSIGTELTRGELINSNAAWIGEQLTGLGFEVIEHITVDDDDARIVDCTRRAMARAKVVVCTGGLGPTSDDRTAEAMARAAKVALRRDQESLERIRQLFADRGLDMPAVNAKQADIPEGATILPNQTGTAPGFGLELDGARLFCLPGVPGEMKPMFERSVIPEVAPLASRTTHQISMRAFGLGESSLAERIEDLDAAHLGITLGYRAHFPEIEVKVLARSENARDAEQKAKQTAEQIKRRLGDVVYGDGEDTFARAVGRMLRNKGLTLAVAESCTGGMIGSMITSAPGSSDYLILDAVTYANAAKTEILGVSPDTLRCHGAVSEETAMEMAEGALRLARSDLAVATTGIAGPGGGTDTKPVGTVWIALAQRNRETTAKRHRLKWDRERIRIMASYLALRDVMRAAQ